ncbi:MAG: methyltransferase domain-containing protein, partial [Actinomycetota bacterium]|nr:methyltransferase domain-containing protein [Actinomycetota bacterium]
MDSVHAYFEAIGGGEWDRFETVRGRSSLEIHRRFLARFVREGDRVLEIGAGPGRFTLQLAELGAWVLVTDFSANQLALNRQRIAAAGLQDAVEGYSELDLRDLTALDDQSFDVALAYGGPLSYVFEDAERCFGELLRVTRRGGVVVASVMSLLGAYRHFLSEVADIDERLGFEVNDRIIRTGDTRHAAEGGHVCRMFRWSGLVEMFGRHPCRLLGASASQWGALGPLETVERCAADAARWERFLDREEAMCAEPGAIDGGNHILFAVERTETRDVGPSG